MLPTIFLSEMRPAKLSKPRLHLVGIPHTQTDHSQTVCAFTTKSEKFTEMMAAIGYETVLYWGERNEAVCSEHVPLFTTAEQVSWYGEDDPNLMPARATWDSADQWWQTLNSRAIKELSKRVESQDLILLLGGWAHQPISDAFPEIISCEWAAGYEGWASKYVCFESYAWRHYCYGQRGLANGRWYDTVIPNFFRPDDFSIATEKGDYLLFVGRLIERKGLLTAHEIAKAVGMPLVIAGSGSTSYQERRLVTADGCVLDDVEYVGTVGTVERNKLMSEAVALLAPTTYIEPFGAVAVEAQLCGTPAVTTDWGAFPETVPSRYRFSTLDEAVQAVEAAASADQKQIREDALGRYSLDVVGPLYDRWFTQLVALWRDGWYELNKAA